jgi:hypothetical protein
LIATLGKSQAKRALVRSSSSSDGSAGSPCQPPSFVFAAIGVVQKPMYSPLPCQR